MRWETATQADPGEVITISLPLTRQSRSIPATLTRKRTLTEGDATLFKNPFLKFGTAK